MPMKDTILADMKTAMKNQDAVKLSALRFLQAAIKNKEIELRPNAITDADVQSVIKKICSQHKDSIEQYKNAGRQDLVDKEQAQLFVVEAYLPKQLPRDQVEKIITEIIGELKATSMKDMGAVIKAALAKTAGTADGKMVSEIVKAKLT